MSSSSDSKATDNSNVTETGAEGSKRSAVSDSMDSLEIGPSSREDRSSPSDGGEKGSGELSRRSMMKHTAAAGAVFGVGLNGYQDSNGNEFLTSPASAPMPPSPSLEDLPDNDIENRPGNFDEPGYPSRESYQVMAENERQAQQQVGDFNGQEVNAVDFLGLGGDTPVNEALEQAGNSIEGKMLFFPEGEYRVTDHVWVSANTAGIRGPNATFVLDPGVKMMWYLYCTNGLYEGFTIDQSARGAKSTEKVKSSGRGVLRNVTKVGFVAQTELAKDPAKSGIMLLPFPQGGGYVRIQNYRAMGGSNAGSHGWVVSSCAPPSGFVADGNGCPGIGVYDGSEGRVDLINCQLRGWENGCYTSKTEGTGVRVIGGVFINNNNASLRLAGERSGADGATVVLDQRRYNVSKMPGPYKPGEIQGLNCVRCEGKGNPYSARLRNLDLRAFKVQPLPDYCNGGMNGVIRIQGTVGAGPIHNCRIESHVPYTAAVKINAADGSGVRRPPPPGAPTDIDMNRLEIFGSPKEEPEISVDGRPNSRVRNSCIHVQGASQSDIQGVSSGNIQNVGYGQNCSPDQKTQGEVGAPGNISNMSNFTGNFTGNFSYQSFRRSRTSQRGIIQQVASAFTSLISALLVIVLLVISVLVGLALVVGVGMYKFIK